MPLPSTSEMRLVGAHFKCWVVVEEAPAVTVQTPPLLVFTAACAVRVVVILTGAVAKTALIPSCCVTYTVGVSAVTVSVAGASWIVVVVMTWVVTCSRQSTSKAFWLSRAFCPSRWNTLPRRFGFNNGDL